MKRKFFSIFIALVTGVFCYSQSANAPQFALVYLVTAAGTNSECTVKYSDGTTEDLKAKLRLPDTKSVFKVAANIEILENYEFSMLKYMYNNGYELLVKSDMKYYFHHK